MLDIQEIQSFYPENIRHFKKNLLAEYIQYKILEIIFGSEFGDDLIFMGGTASHIMYQNNRFSEDLDFDNTGLSEKDFRELVKLIERRLALEGYVIQTRYVLRGAYRCYIRIPKVLFDNRLSGHKEEKLLIQLDMEPQGFKYNPEKLFINKFDVFLRINAAPMDILLSQKIYAIFKRKRPMGRDFYDAMFLFGRTKPNFGYLIEKLGIKDEADLKKKLLRHCEKLDFKQLAQDVEPFLFVPSDAKKVLSFRDYIKSL